MPDSRYDSRDNVDRQHLRVAGGLSDVNACPFFTPFIEKMAIRPSFPGI
jgi:hypothetical protein